MARTSVPIPRAGLPTPEGMQEFQRNAVQTISLLVNGRMNAVGDVTLTAGTTTTLANTHIHPLSVIVFAPTNAAAYALGLPYASTRGDKTATLTHPSAAGTETYAWAAFG